MNSLPRLCRMLLLVWVAPLAGCATSGLRREVAELRRQVRQVKMLSLDNAKRLSKLSDQLFLLEDKVDSNRVALARSTRKQRDDHPPTRPAARPVPRRSGRDERPEAAGAAHASDESSAPAPVDVTEPPRLRVVKLRPRSARRRPVLRLTGQPRFAPLGGPPIRDRLPVAPVPPIPRFGGPVQEYKAAYALYRKGRFAEAARKFAAFVRRHPRHPLADNALFWQGQCEYRLGRYSDAAKTYRSVLRKYPAGNKAPDALFKLALTYLKLGRRAEARHLLSQVVAIYPGTRLAKAAAAYLER